MICFSYFIVNTIIHYLAGLEYFTSQSSGHLPCCFYSGLCGTWGLLWTQVFSDSITSQVIAEIAAATEQFPWSAEKKYTAIFASHCRFFKLTWSEIIGKAHCYLLFWTESFRWIWSITFELQIHVLFVHAYLILGLIYTVNN